MKARRAAPAGRALAIAVVAVAAAAALGYAVYKEVDDPRFAPGAIDVRGESRVLAGDIVAAAALPNSANIWLVGLGAPTRRVESLPWIESAQIRRMWPNRVAIEVVERRPAARIPLPAGGSAEEPAADVAIIDPTLRVLTVGPLDARDAALPVLRVDPQPAGLRPGATASDPGLQQAYDALVQLRALGLRVSEIDMNPATGMTVVCGGGLRVILGSSDDLAKKVDLLRAIEPKIAAPRDVVYVDLRSVRAPTVLYR